MSAVATVRQREDAAIARALKILSARVREPGGDQVSSLSAALHLGMLHLAERDREVFAVAFLDAQRRVIAFEELFQGTLTQTQVYPREIARAALLRNAGAVVLFHNHPSGEPVFSAQDEALTEALRGVLAIFEIEILDHILIAGARWASYAALRATRDSGRTSHESASRREVQSIAMRAAWARRKARAEAWSRQERAVDRCPGHAG